ncbi:DJ-1/PfpI family protein [Mycoplasmopsis alligatoris]|uniref:DJ-1/PfpI family protein n=1 Tax=Mycoplasmopsis alligatoris A21JP2 TaxID=747682 RepID=D4XWF1_9BACT|nr:DJ-1/PfpI family protein [Mycoplasmopsis alligatoris]EFF41152.1 DJ-1/PfpI family protein [Mycoplasmopsis alligatoris A21JP2]
MKLLVLVHNRFNDVELTGVVACLERTKKLDDIVYYNPKYTKAIGQFSIIKLNMVNKVDFNEFDILFVPGGPGAQELRKDKESLKIIEKFIQNKKYVISICDAPNVIYENHIIDDSIPYSSYPIPNMVASNLRNDNMVTNHKGKFLSGKCAGAAVDLGIEAVKEIFGKEMGSQAKIWMYAKK